MLCGIKGLIGVMGSAPNRLRLEFYFLISSHHPFCYLFIRILMHSSTNAVSKGCQANLRQFLFKTIYD